MMQDRDYGYLYRKYKRRYLGGGSQDSEVTAQFERLRATEAKGSKHTTASRTTPEEEVLSPEEFCQKLHDHIDNQSKDKQSEDKQSEDKQSEDSEFQHQQGILEQMGKCGQCT